jgi:hypothetical protein
MTGTMSKERRIPRRARPHPRYPVEVQIMSGNFLDIFEARDISTSGAAIFVPYRFEGCELTSPVDLVITLPKGEAFKAKGRIVHFTQTDLAFFGVEFEGLPQERLLEIERYVERRLADEDAEDVLG